MAELWDCYQCGKPVSGPAAKYGIPCDDCSGKTAAARAETDRWNALSIEQKVEELKKRLDTLPPNDWRNVPI